jgi:two-component sensor histidine kinase
MTLRTGLVLVVVAALLPISALSIVQAMSTLRYSQTLIGNQLVTSALATAGHESAPLIIGRQMLSMLSANPAVRAGGAGCRDALEASLINSPALLNFAKSDAKGRVQCSVLPFAPSTSFENEAWWQHGIKARDFTISAVVVGQISKERAIIAMQPITAVDGSNDGAVTAAIDASWLERSLQASGISHNSAVAIIDGRGRVVLTSETRELPRFDVEAGNAKVARAEARNGTAWMYAVAPLYERELYVVYAEPTDALMAKAFQQMRYNLVLPLVALIFASLAIWFGTNFLVLRWLDKLRTMTGQIASGNFSGGPELFARAPNEIALLGADLHNMSLDIQAHDLDLQAALNAKIALTHDIHHRVKNNLQIVSSLLNLQAGKIHDPAARDALGQTRARIGALAQIHRLLYEESHDSDNGIVNIASLLNALCSQLRSLHRGQVAVHLLCDAASQTVPINSAVPLTLLAVEAVTNAYRHGFRGRATGTVIVHFDVTGDQATLSITDDGTGFDVSHESNSMGRQLMDAFAQQLGGTLDIVSSPAGTIVTLRYPFDPNPAIGMTLPSR